MRTRASVLGCPAVDLTLSPEEEAFRDELRSWLDANHPGREPEGDEAGFEFRRDWQKALYEAGWAGLSWPQEYGGRGATLVEQAIFNEEIVRAKAPQLVNVLGLAMAGPTVIAHGTDEQKQRYLPRLMSGAMIAAYALTEPGSGSDALGAKTKAVSVPNIGSRSRSMRVSKRNEPKISTRSFTP